MDRVDCAGYDLAIEKMVIQAARYFKNKHEVDLRQDALASVRMRECVEEMVRKNERILVIPFITATSNGPKHLEVGYSGREIRSARKYLNDA